MADSKPGSTSDSAAASKGSVWLRSRVSRSPMMSLRLPELRWSCVIGCGIIANQMAPVSLLPAASLRASPTARCQRLSFCRAVWHRGL